MVNPEAGSVLLCSGLRRRVGRPQVKQFKTGIKIHRNPAWLQKILQFYVADQCNVNERSAIGRKWKAEG